MSRENLEDYRWLVSPDAEPFLAAGADTNGSLVRITLSLRKELGPARTHLIIAQTELRRRAGVKFSLASRMFFTRQLLEQATDEQIANYKASRFAEGETIADLCCGIGGDLLSMARRGPVAAVDKDPIALLLAKANCRANGVHDVEFLNTDVNRFNVDDYQVWHLDPDRRPAGKRTTRIELHSPDAEAIERMLQANGKGVVKLAPASRLPKGWSERFERFEREWIGNRRECRQQLLWFDTLARFPGHHVATVFSSGSKEPYIVHGSPRSTERVADQLGRFVYEPHAAILAARLSGVLADKHDLPSVSPRIPYLTSDQAVTDPALACFEVLEQLPLDPKHIRKAVRARNIGNLEVKKRGVRIDPEDVRRQINPRGEESGALLLVPVRKHPVALLTRRIVTQTL